MDMNRRAGSWVMIFLIFTGALATTQTSKPIDYETFCKLPDVQAKSEAFRAAAPEIRAALVRTQLKRWRDANRTKVTPEQLAYLEELIASITLDTYQDGPAGEAQRVKARAIAEKQRGLFTAEQVQAMQPDGPCIAKSK